MKKILIALVFAFAIAIAIPKSAYCMAVVQNVGVSLTVNSLFQLNLDPPGGSGGSDGITWSGDAGQTLDGSEGDLNIHVVTNHGVQWTLTMQVESFIHSDLTTTIPGSVLTYFMFGGSGVRAANPPTYVPCPTSVATIYTSDPSESNLSAPGLGQGLRFQMTIPMGQKVGNYTSTVHLALVDGI